MKYPTPTGGKSQQFMLGNIDTIFTFYQPKPPISKFVDCFWLYQGHNPERKTELILPTGRLELVFNLRRDEMLFSGAFGRSFVPAAQEDLCMIGVHFKPGGAFPFLGLPAGDLADIHVDLDLIWGSLAVRLRERLCEAGTSAERFHIIEKALLDRLSRGFEHHYAIPVALEMFGSNSGGPIIRETAKYLGLSQRRFIQVFKMEVGITPKLFSRIQRFQKMRFLIDSDQSPDWASLAFDLGYFDQSHLISEFHEFSGLSPTDYIARHKNPTEYVKR